MNSWLNVFKIKNLKFHRLIHSYYYFSASIDQILVKANVINEWSDE